MPANQQKMVSMIVSLCNDVEERCVGYRSALVDLVGDILLKERSHRMARTNVQKAINDKCSATGRYLASARGGGRGSKGGAP